MKQVKATRFYTIRKGIEIYVIRDFNRDTLTGVLIFSRVMKLLYGKKLSIPKGRMVLLKGTEKGDHMAEFCNKEEEILCRIVPSKDSSDTLLLYMYYNEESILEDYLVKVNCDKEKVKYFLRLAKDSNETIDLEDLIEIIKKEL